MDRMKHKNRTEIFFNIEILCGIAGSGDAAGKGDAKSLLIFLLF
jgi:hypothetical protein